MALSFQFSQGQPVEARIASPAAAAAAGAIVAIGNLLSIAHAPVVLAQPAVVSVGPARYRCLCATGDVPAEIAAGARIYLDGDNKLTDDDGKHFGFAPALIAANATEFEVIFAPDGSTVTD